MTAYRTLVSVQDAQQINSITKSTTFWYGVDGAWIYTTPLNDEDWEITVRAVEPDDDAANRSTWGRDADPAAWAGLAEGLCESARQLLSLATNVKRYDYFGANRLETVVYKGNTALIGDASHPLSGAFGAGAAFAFEDAHVLAGSLRWAAATGRSLDSALELFNQVRSLHYEALFQTLDEIAVERKRISREARSVEENIVGQIDNVSNPKHNWMLYHDVSLFTLISMRVPANDIFQADKALAEAIKQVERSSRESKI